MNTIDGRRRRRTHSAEFKAKVVAACREPGISIASVALAHGLNANLLRRWVVTAESVLSSNRFDGVSAPVSLERERPAFLPLQVGRPAVVGVIFRHIGARKFSAYRSHRVSGI